MKMMKMIKQRDDKKKWTPPIHGDLRFFVRIGLILFLFLAPISRGLFLPEDYLPALVGVGALGLAAMLAAWVHRRDLPSWRWEYLLVLLAPLGYFLAVFHSVDQGQAVEGVLIQLSYLVLFGAALISVREGRHFETLGKSFFLIHLLMAFLSIAGSLGVFSIPAVYAGKGLIGFYQYANVFGIMMLLAVVLGYYYWVTASSVAAKGYYAMGVVLLAIGMLGSFSRMTWLLAPLALLALYFVFSRGDRRYYLYTLAVSLVLSLTLSKGYLGLIDGKPHSKVFVLLMAGALFVGALEFFRAGVLRWMEQFRGNPLFRKGMIWGAVLYCAVAVVSLFIYSQGVEPASGVLVPGQVQKETATIQVSDNSWQTRLDMYRDGFKIIKDHGLWGVGDGGWNQLYHQYQTYMYWSTETHSHPIQQWIEGGALASLGFWGITLAALYRLGIHWRRSRRESLDEESETEDEGKVKETYGIAVGGILLVLLLAHSALDFDMSYPFIQGFYFLLLGALLALLPRSKNGLGQKWVWMGYALVIGALAFVTLVGARDFYIAGNAAAAGAKAVAQKDYAQGEKWYRQAVQRHPWNGGYAMDLAQLVAARGEIGEGIELGRRVRNLNPNDLRLNHVLVIHFASTGLVDESLAAAERLILANPWNGEAYELATQAYWMAGEAVEQQGEINRAKIFYQLAAGMPQRVEAQIGLIDQERKKRWHGQALKVTPVIQDLAKKADQKLASIKG